MTDDALLPPGDPTEDMEEFTVRVPRSMYEDLVLIADLWTAVDRQRGIKRRKWAPASVVRHFATLQHALFIKQLGEQWPKDQKGRDAFVRTQLAHLKKK